MPVRPFLVLLAIALSGAGASAQAPSGSPSPGAAPSVTPSTQEIPDANMAALRYFAQQGDTRRLQREIARLKALYPDWTPPDELLSGGGMADPVLARLWTALSEGRLAELRKMIALQRAEQPDWTPPPDLLQQLSTAETREQLINASDLKQYETVIRVALAAPSLRTCANVDVMWRLAEAFARTGSEDRARDAYVYLLRNCDDPAERLATVQKAMALLPASDVETLLAYERRLADGTGEFETVRADLARLRVASALERNEAVETEDVVEVERLAETVDTAQDPLLLGWYNLEREDFAAAETWFRTAEQRGGSIEAARGLGLALLGQKRPAAAEAALYDRRRDSPETRAAYLSAVSALLTAEPPAAIEPAVLQRIAAEVASARNATTAQQLGWYAYALGQTRTAGQWFETALAWDPAEENAAYGFARALERTSDRDRLSKLVGEWSARSPRIAALGRGAAATPTRGAAERRATAAGATAATRASRASTASPSRAGCAGTVDPNALAPSTALGQGWCLLDKNRPLEAAAAFEAALRGSSQQQRSDAAYGQSLSYLRLGLTDNAAVAATRAPQSPARVSELSVALLTQRATAAFEAGRYNEALILLDERRRLAPKRSDLMVLRGYAYARLGRFQDAQRMFEAVAATGDREGIRGLAVITELRQGAAGSSAGPIIPR